MFQKLLIGLGVILALLVLLGIWGWGATIAPWYSGWTGIFVVFGVGGFFAFAMYMAYADDTPQKTSILTTVGISAVVFVIFLILAGPLSGLISKVTGKIEFQSPVILNVGEPTPTFECPCIPAPEFEFTP